MVPLIALNDKFSLNPDKDLPAALAENDEVSGSGGGLNGVEIVTGSLMMGPL